MSAKRLLVADDSLTIQKVIRLALSNEGYEIEAVSDGNDASQQIAVFRPDIVLVDVSLPGKSAYTLKLEYNLEAEKKEIHFILMSSAFESIDEKKFTDLGFSARLMKPFDPAHLRSVLASALGSALSSNFDSKSVPLTSASPLSDDIWDQKIELEKHSPRVSSPSEPEDDIRKLTEATIRSSGLDQMDWAVDEPAKKIATFIEDDKYQKKVPTDPTLPPLKNMFDKKSVTFNILTTDPVPDRQLYFNAPEDPFESNSVSPPPPPATGIGAPSGLDSKKIEATIEQEIRVAIEKAVREKLPEIAEKLIKAEIHKLLSNPPT